MTFTLFELAEFLNLPCLNWTEITVFTWVPSHIGIDGNDLADELAKIGLSNKKIKI